MGGDMPELSVCEIHRRDCLARHLLRTWTRQDITEWLNDSKKNNNFREDMRMRLNMQKSAIKAQHKE